MYPAPSERPRLFSCLDERLANRFETWCRAIWDRAEPKILLKFVANSGIF